MPSGPCIICGTVNYEPSLGGPDICPSCDCGHFGPDIVRAQGEQIRELIKELDVIRRLVRVDTALVQQLRESIEANAKLRQENEQLRAEVKKQS